MKRVLGILGIVCGYLWYAPGYAEIVDQIVAILDEELILRSEVRESVRKPVVKAFANLEADGELEKAALDYMLERRLLAREVQYLAFPKEEELSRSLATQYLIDTYYHKDTQAFTAKMQALGLTAPDLIPELTLYMKGIDYIRRKHRFSEDIDNPTIVLELFQKWMTALQTRTKIQTSF